MNNKDKDRAAGQATALWRSGNPFDRILATIILLFLGSFTFREDHHVTISFMGVRTTSL